MDMWVLNFKVHLHIYFLPTVIVTPWIWIVQHELLKCFMLGFEGSGFVVLAAWRSAALPSILPWCVALDTWETQLYHAAL
jgi:hypothetical protein